MAFASKTHALKIRGMETELMIPNPCSVISGLSFDATPIPLGEAAGIGLEDEGFALPNGAGHCEKAIEADATITASFWMPGIAGGRCCTKMCLGWRKSMA
jgi:hypothetical protein